MQSIIYINEIFLSRPDGIAISREHFLLALADVKAILIKATYTTNNQLASLDSASIDTAEPNGYGPPALHVEQCVCPRGYVGTSCEDCAPGYTRLVNNIIVKAIAPVRILPTNIPDKNMSDSSLGNNYHLFRRPGSK